jgi:hypothetical protein
MWGRFVHSAILYCPHLDRDIRGILAHVPDPMILTGYPTKHGCDGCLDMHQRAVYLAMKNGWPSIFVMEDDCEFTPHFSMAQWEADGEWARRNGYGVITGGSVNTWNPKKVREGLIEVDTFCSAHCVLYLESGYAAAMQATQPYDMTLGRALLTYPFVAVQKPSFSGILQQSVNYVPDYERHEMALARVVR